MGKMPGETTPLITTVQVGTVPRRYPHHTLRRFCSVALGSSLVALLVTFLWTVAFAPVRHHHHHHHHDHAGHHNGHVTFEELKAILLETPSGEKASEWSKYYTAGPHLAGKNLSQVCRLLTGRIPSKLMQPGGMDTRSLDGMGYQVRYRGLRNIHQLSSRPPSGPPGEVKVKVKGLRGLDSRF